MTSVWLPFLRRIPRSSSIPMINIKRIRPIWLKMLSDSSESGAKRNPNVSGKKWPSSDGPSTMPATISPITPGWPRYLNSHEKIRMATRSEMICNSSMATGWCTPSCSDCVKSSSGAGQEAGACCTATWPETISTASRCVLSKARSHNLPSRITIQKSPPKIRSIRT